MFTGEPRNQMGRIGRAFLSALPADGTARRLRQRTRELLIAAGFFLICAAAPVVLHAAGTTAVPPHLPLSKDLWVGKFSQCSYNALGSVLTYYYGPDHSKTDRRTFEHTVFYNPLDATGFGSFYGWGPWTSYMVESGKMVWNNQPVTGLRAERFSLRPAQLPVRRDSAFIVHYADGERDALRARLLKELARGPVVMWTCYAAAQEGILSSHWHHVSRIDDHTDAVPFGPFTHSVTLYLLPRNRQVAGLSGDVDRVMVSDCSLPQGVFVTDPDTLVSTAAAMTAFVRQPRPGDKSILDGGVNGIKDDEYNVVFFPAAAASQGAVQRL